MSVFVIGAAAVRLLLRLCDPSSANLADATVDLQEIARRATGDERDARRLHREIEAIGDELLRRLNRQIQVEFRGLAQNDKEAAALAVRDAILRLTSSERDLFTQISPDPTSLVRAAYQMGGASSWKRDLGQDVAGLADLMLRECSHSVVAAYRKSPQLSIDLLVQLLTRVDDLNLLIAELAEAVESVPSRIALQTGQAARSDETRKYQEFTTEYLRAVDLRSDRLTIYGLDMALENRSFSLTTGYISLRALSVTTGSSETETRLEDLIPRIGTFYIEGEAGGGKTTALQWMAVQCARRTMPAKLSHLSECIPFLIKLRNYADAPLPELSSLANATVGDILLAEPPGWLGYVVGTERTTSEDASDLPRVLLLVDGLDEFPESRADELRDWLNLLRGSLRSVVTVITGRPAAAPIATILSRSQYAWTKVELLDMNRTEIRAFVRHWHRSLEDPSRTIESSGLDATRVADQLTEQREYRRLASTPLLAGCLCALAHARRGALPSSRIQIYNTLVDLLVERREKTRNVRVSQVAGITTEHKMVVLQELAGFMLRNSLSEISTDRALRCVARALATMPDASADASDVFTVLVRRSGLIREPSPGVIDFTHRTFLEYLAAISFAENDDIELLASQGSNPAWAEAIILTAGVANRRQGESLLLGLRNTLRESQMPPWMIRICAGMLHTCVRRTDDMDAYMKHVLLSVIPPRSASDANALSAGGDAIVDRLVDWVTEHTTEDFEPELIIKALVDIGTPDALLGLAQLPSEVRLSGLTPLLEAWAWFDEELFAELVLRDLSPEDPVQVTVRSTSVFPFLSELSSQFLWTADIELPGSSFDDDCRARPPLTEIVVQWVPGTATPYQRSGALLWDLPQLKSATLGQISDLCPEASLPGDVQRDPSVQRLSVTIAPEADLDIGGLNFITLLQVDGHGSIRDSANGRTLDLLTVSGNVTIEGMVEVVSAVLTSVPEVSLRSIMTRSLKELQLHGTDFDVSILATAQGLESLTLDAESSDGLLSLTDHPTLDTVVLIGHGLLGRADYEALEGAFGVFEAPELTVEEPDGGDPESTFSSDFADLAVYRDYEGWDRQLGTSQLDLDEDSEAVSELDTEYLADEPSDAALERIEREGKR